MKRQYIIQRAMINFEANNETGEVRPPNDVINPYIAAVNNEII